MVTDEEYKALVSRVDELENRLKLLSQSYSRLLMKSDMPSTETEKQQEHKKHKDVTKYEFEGRQYNKRQLVLESVKSYIKKKRIKDSEKLLEVFPDYIQGSLGMIKKVEDDERYANASKRFYFADKDIIHLKDGDYVICSQWDSGNINRFIKLATDLELDIKPITRKYMD